MLRSSDQTIQLWNIEVTKLLQLSLKRSNLICFSSCQEHALTNAAPDDEITALLDLEDVTVEKIVDVRDQEWVCIGPTFKLLFYVPSNYSINWYSPGTEMVIPAANVELDLSDMVHGASWEFCYKAINT